MLRIPANLIRSGCHVLRDILRWNDRAAVRAGGRIGVSVAIVLAFLAFQVKGASRISPDPDVRFAVFSAHVVTGLVYLPHEDAAPCAVVFYPTTRSPRYEHRGTRPLRFFEVDSATVVAETTIPAGMTDALLLFEAIAASSPGGLRYRIHLLDDGGKRQPMGGFSIVNFSGLTLSGMIGPQAVTLHEGLNPVFRIGNSARVLLRVLFKGRHYQAYADTIDLKGDERGLLILLPPYYKGSLELQSRLLIDKTNVDSARTRQR